jgi:RNA polymerase sigma-70 factor (ECF subfamily)
VVDLDRHLGSIAAGDPDAFALWVAGAERSLRDGLRSFAAQVDTDAVLQETLLRVWQVAPRVEPDGKPNALLRMAARIARNLALSWLRSQRPALERDGVLDPPVDPVEPDPLLARLVRFCLDRLPRQPRAAFLARLGGGGLEDDAALAARLQMRPNTFFQNVGRARRLLLRCLEEKGARLEASP